MRENSSEITKYIHIARENHKKGNIYQANEIYRKLINQKIYTYDLLMSYGLFCVDIKNLKRNQKKPANKAGLFMCVVLINN